MVFSSHLFVYYFLPLALAAYFLAPRRAQNLVLTLFSFVFYGWANVAFIPLLMTSTLIDYFCGLGLTGGFRLPWRGELPLLEPGAPRSRSQKVILTVSITANLLLLGFFKYFNFTVDSYNTILSAFGFTGLRLDSVMRVVLPLGISFYTFKCMSYAIDVYRGDARAMRDILDFFCFVSMFPHLVAGPIVRFSEIADQLAHRTITSEKFARGVAFFCLGMAKKVLLANPCGKIADTAFAAASLGALDAWQGLFAYAFQIYFDFSGYSDMAIGLGADARLHVPQELRLALPGRIDHRLLAPLAHVALDLAARLPLHPARRQPQGRDAHLPQPRRSSCCSAASGTARPGPS